MAQNQRKTMRPPHERLIPATPNDIYPTGLEIILKELHKGALKSNFLPGPGRHRLPAGYQPNFGSDINPNMAVLPQFPMEVLIKICAYLDPIWVFQLELTCTTMARRLRSREGNRLWYNSIPPTLKAMPELFQHEEAFAQRLPNAPFEFDSQPNPAGVQVAYATPWTHGGLDSSINTLVNLPALRSVNVTAPLYIYMQHLKGTDRIPLLHYAVSDTPVGTRVRTLAIGGPYQVNFNYRRELLGYLLLTRRCNICLEAPIVSGTPIQPHEAWHTFGGVELCSLCYPEWTVRTEQTREIPEAYKYLCRFTPQSRRMGHWSHDRYNPWQNGQVHWRPMVDDFIRQKCGLDFETLLAKQMYFRWLIATLKYINRDRHLYYGRQDFRTNILLEAQHQWRNADARDPLGLRIALLRDNNIIRTADLPNILFRPELIDINALGPQAPGEEWLDDPVDAIRYTRDVKGGRGITWYSNKAQEMLVRLAEGYAGDRCRDALEKYHVQRLRSNLTSDTILASLAAAGPMGSMSIMAVVKKKLFLEDGRGFAHGAMLTPAGRDAAKIVIGPLLQATISCTQPGCAAAPRGLEEMVHHMRMCHANVFIGSWQWQLA
ncbi:hypothetical protein LTR10_015825 [Elasticomyces elasticus]|uniref:F-box domain-containing protein n=1 Tax=Exophiala sideris TaxID=1016849 RepID=A0ABR0IY66_9EURO|nr:hypothetical protein LTR10_015825 [Elasticomyces elasticus]KAK5022503.1 hypothetical protein LTS07_009949 [Exophiala sideris]KAK5028031.1 hypothetical protein LTR13_009260 [Exophiala sideris]KAK5051772.1 hypothetical protein LTR69_010063 [Exophiala sideris]KAK5177896.1 hypothetical protein LTR44_009661 [Eurotiomycetes sp. CCFEE 6388]